MRETLAGHLFLGVDWHLFGQRRAAVAGHGSADPGSGLSTRATNLVARRP